MYFRTISKIYESYDFNSSQSHEFDFNLTNYQNRSAVISHFFSLKPNQN